MNLNPTNLNRFINLKTKTMKRFFFVLAVLFISSIVLHKATAQQLIVDTVSVTPLQGIYGGFGLISQGSEGVKTTLNVGYLNELKLGRTTSLILSGSLLNSLYSIYTLPPFSVFDSYGYALQLSVGIQPRLYINDYAGQFAAIKTTLNSGWFISLPFEINSSILSNSNPFRPSLFLGAAVGYRYAVSKKVFLEATGGLGTTYLNLIYFITTPYLNLKACYTL
jgi:hypothetical protein